MWNIKTKVILVIIEATGTITKSFSNYLNNIPGKHKIKELQTTSVLGTAHILRKLSISSTNECTFLFLFNSPYICFGRDSAIITVTANVNNSLKQCNGCDNTKWGSEQ
jgi:hypothetical protein